MVKKKKKKKNLADIIMENENWYPSARIYTFLKKLWNPTHIYVTQQIIEATVAVVGGAAESLEDAEPLGTQGATIRRQLRTQDPNIVHPGSTFTWDETTARDRE